MTYITPDDWGLNNDIAPGDARGPQPFPEPMPTIFSGNASRGLAPAPPFRGYFGRQPAPPVYDTRTHSPFAVPDGLWTQGVVPLNKLQGEGVIGPVLPSYTGVQGLGWVPTPRGLAFFPIVRQRRLVQTLSGLGEVTAQEALEGAQKEMKRAAMESAAAQLALTIALNYIPVVGTAVSIVLGVMMAMGNHHYKQKVQWVMAGLENDLNKLGASYQARLHSVKMAVFEQEKNAGIQLALSGATLENESLGGGLGSWGGDKWRKTWKRVVNPVHHVSVLVKAIQKPAQGMLRQVQRITPDSVDRIIQKPINQMDKDQRELDRIQGQMEEKLATLSGEQQWVIAQERAAQAHAAASKDMEAQYQAAVLNIQSPQYRQALQVELAKRIRSDPSMAALLSTISGSAAQSLVARLTGELPNAYASAGQPGAGIPIFQQTSTGEKAAIGVLPILGAVVAFIALGGRG